MKCRHSAVGETAGANDCGCPAKNTVPETCDSLCFSHPHKGSNHSDRQRMPKRNGMEHCRKHYRKVKHPQSVFLRHLFPAFVTTQNAARHRTEQNVAVNAAKNSHEKKHLNIAVPSLLGVGKSPITYKPQESLTTRDYLWVFYHRGMISKAVVGHSVQFRF